MRYYLIVPKTTFDKLEMFEPGTDTINPNYDAQLAQSLVSLFSSHQFGLAFNNLRRNLANPPDKAIVEVEYDKTITDANGNEVIDETPLQALVTAGVIVDYAKGIHSDSEQKDCIYCYMQKNSTEWFNIE